MVRLKGLEPTRVAAREPKSRMSTNSITGADEWGGHILQVQQIPPQDLTKTQVNGTILSE